MLLPGFPLSHPDHEWLGRALVGSRMGCRRLGLYVEQPYGRRADRDPRVPSWAEEAFGEPPLFGSISAPRHATGSRSGGRFASTGHSFPSSA